MSVLLTLFVTIALLVAGGSGCGSGRTGGPRGDPAEVVDAAPDLTLDAGGALFEASTRTDQRAGAVDFEAAPAPAPAGADGSAGSARQPEVANPGAVVDLVRGALSVESYGGAAVRGASTFRYEAVINTERAIRETPADRRPELEALARALGSPAFYVDVWIDEEGRLRRVQLPVEKTTERPAARSKAMPALVTVDFFEFQRP